MNEIEHLFESNSWIAKDGRNFSIHNMYFNKDFSRWSHHDIILSTDQGYNFVIEFKTYKKIYEIMHDKISWDGKFVLGIDLNDNSGRDWRSVLYEATLNKKGTICFLNFEHQNLLKDECEVYLEAEIQKLKMLDSLTTKSQVHIFGNKDEERVLFTSDFSSHNNEIIVGCPPRRCDILIARAEFVDAIPDNCLKKYLKQNGIIIHFGRLKCKSPNQTIDAVALNMHEYRHWVDDFFKYISLVPIQRNAT